MPDELNTGAPSTTEARPFEPEEHVHLPAPSIWPVTVAFGIATLSFGVLSNIAFIVFGAVVIAIGAFGWAGELRRE
jgi:hypothetical protein